MLEIQDRTLEFSVTCTELMLADQAIKAVATSDHLQSTPTVGSGLIFDNGTSSAEQPTALQSTAYRLPQQASLGYFGRIASTKKDKAKDEMCM